MPGDAPSMITAPFMSENGRTRIRSKSSQSGRAQGRQYAHVLSSFAVQAKVVDFLCFWMSHYWQRDWEATPDLIAYCRRFTKKIRCVYRADVDNWEPGEIDKGSLSLSPNLIRCSDFLFCRSPLGGLAGPNDVAPKAPAQGRRRLATRGGRGGACASRHGQGEAEAVEHGQGREGQRRGEAVGGEPRGAGRADHAAAV